MKSIRFGEASLGRSGIFYCAPSFGDCISLVGKCRKPSACAAAIADSSRALWACGQGTAFAVPFCQLSGRRRATVGAKRLKSPSSLGNTQPDAMLMLLPDGFVQVHHSACARSPCN